MARPDPASVELLRARAEQLHGRADQLIKVGGQLLYGVFPATVKAFVWASHRGVDPTPAVLKTIYGTAPIGDAGHAHIAALVQHLSACAHLIQTRRAA